VSARRISVADAAGELSALVWGRPEEAAETLLLIHPANLQGRCWEPVVDALDPGQACVAVDLRGHGSSTRSGSFDVAAWAAESRRVARACGAGRVHLVGASVGAAIAVELAADHPEEVRSLTALGGAFLPAPVDGDPLLGALRERDLDPTLAAEMVDGALTAEAQADLRERIVADVSLNAAPVASAIWRAALATDARDRRAEIEAPCLALVGELDQVCPAEQSRWFADEVGGETRVLPGLGHLFLYERPELVAGAIMTQTGVRT
jgi:pimeloyl-ACP methyl ester carboxylesterase